MPLSCVQSNNIFICVVDYIRQFSISLVVAVIVVIVVFIRCYLVSTICAAHFCRFDFYFVSVSKRMS